MKKQILLFILLLPAWSALASSNYYPRDFESKSSSLRDEALKASLHEVLNSFHIKQATGPDTLALTCTASETSCYRHMMLSYKDARRLLFGKIDLEKDATGYFLKDVYCDRKMRGGGVGPNLIPSAAVVNCEHTWPQSKFSNTFPRDLQKGDLHHLYSTDSKANSTRGNNPFGEVVAGDMPTEDCEASQIGGINTHIGGMYFEPPNFHKGNVARSIFYFAVRYKMPVDKTQEDTLRAWHKADPIDQAEKDRNEKVFAEQKNRNPFIDFPELVDQISDF